jgi:hypothetical protein
LGIHPCNGIHHGPSPRHLNYGYSSTVIPPDNAKGPPVLNSLLNYLQLGNRRSCTSSPRALRTILFLSDALTAPIPSLIPKPLHQRFSRRHLHNRAHHRCRAPSSTKKWLRTAPFYRGRQRGGSRKRRHCGLDCKLDKFPKRPTRLCGCCDHSGSISVWTGGAKDE